MGRVSGNQRLGDNLYSDSVLALDADTGALKWHYQFTPHDDMDWDAAEVPVLVDMTWDGRPCKVMLFANKNGIFYVLGRVTGEFLLGKPFVEVNWLSGFDAKGRPILVPGKVSDAKATANATFPPRSIDKGDPALRVLPAAATNWQPASFSPQTGLFYVSAWERGAELGVPLIGKGGYGAIRAIDPRTGARRWEFRMDDAIFAGLLTTASGVLFTGSAGDFYSASGPNLRVPRLVPDPAWAADGHFFALDARTGAVLWRTSLGAGVVGAPTSFAVAGRQYVAVNAGRALFVFTLRR